jgi:GT2 family glycosyltransferase
MHQALPPITVIVSTKDRPSGLVRTVETLLLNNYPEFEVRVCDQSGDDLTATLLRHLRSDPRLRYERTTTRGLSAGRNRGIEAANSELIALTDDDCETPANWLGELAGAFSVDPNIGIVFGSVHAGPHDSSQGFVPAYRRKTPYMARCIREKHRVEGIGACMGLRRSLWQDLGGFDEFLGPGAPLLAADDTDFAVRALLGGYHVYETPDFNVIHHGFRGWQEGRSLIYGYLYGYGGMFAKHLKCRNWPVLFLLAQLIWRWAFGAPVVQFGHLPSRWLRLRAFVEGFAAGAGRPVNSATCHYVSC